jgi:hypothetical protein
MIGEPRTLVNQRFSTTTKQKCMAMDMPARSAVRYLGLRTEDSGKRDAWRKGENLRERAKSLGNAPRCKMQTLDG